MATNPMQRKSRNSFLLGMFITLIFAIVIVFLLYTKIKNQQEQIEKYVQTTTSVYVLNQNVVSGQVLTPDMFTMTSGIPTVTVPADYKDIIATMQAYSLCTSDGTPIYTEYDEQKQLTYYILGENNTKNTIYVTANGKEEKVQYLTTNEKGAYYYSGENKTDKKSIKISENAIIAKVNMSANTIITSSMITRSNEKTTSDLRQTEYNVITLPVDAFTGDYIDVRLMLPNGQDFIVASKKKITVPMANGAYLSDTIQMNLNEAEILTLSCAIVEHYQIEGSKLYAVKYAEAGMQNEAKLTYSPNNEVINLIKEDPNIVNQAINQIRRNDINSALGKYGNEENVTSGMQESITATQEERKQYLQSLTGTTGY